MTLNELFTNIANAIRRKKGTSEKIVPTNFESEIESIETGTDTSDATATANDILLGKTAYVNDEKIEGTIEMYDYSHDEGGDSYSTEDGLIEGALTSYTNDRVTKLRNGVFYNNRTLESVSFPNVTSIGDSAFCYNVSLKTAYFPKVTEIPQMCFNDTALENFDFSNIIKIGMQAFSKTRLVNVDARLITSLSGNAFSYNDYLESVNFPNVTRLEAGYTFQYCPKLESIDLHLVTYIGGGNTFAKCTGLKNVNLSSYTRELRAGTFEKCTSLETITSHCNQLDAYCFRNCTSLKTAYFPKCKTLLNSYHFDNCTALTDVYLGYDGLVTNSSTTTFRNCPAGVKVHVRSEYADQYASATNWSSLIADGTIVIVGDYKEE